MGYGTLIETRSIDYVPLAERHGKVWQLWPVWFSGDAHLATLAVGVLGIILGGNLLWTSLAVILGCLLGTFFMAFHSTQGPQLGLPQMIQSRPQFGYTGALLVWGVAMVSYIGYNAFNTVLAVQALHQLTASIPATSTAAMVLFALIALSLAVFGYDKIHLAQRGLAYLMIVVLSVFSVGALFLLKLPAAQWDTGGFRAVPFLAQLFAAASYQLSWSIYVSDYSRYLPPDVGVRESFWWTFLGAFIGGAWMMLVGTVAAAAAPGLNVAAAHAERGRRGAAGPGQGPAVQRGARPGDDILAQLLWRLAHALERRRHGEAAGVHRRQAPDEPAGGLRGERLYRGQLLQQLRQPLPGPARRCCSTCSRRGPRSTWWTSTWCARATTRSARSSIPSACTGAGTGAASPPTSSASSP